MIPPMSEPRITRSMARTGQTPAAPKSAAAPRTAFADLSNAAAAQVVEEPLVPAAAEELAEEAPPTPVMAMPSPSQAAPTPTGLGLSSMLPLTPVAAGPARATEPNPTPMQGVPATSSKAQAAIQAAINALQGGSDDDDVAAIACSPLSGEEEEEEEEETLEDILGTPLSELYPTTAAKAAAPAAPACPPTEPAAAAAAPAAVRSAIVIPSPSTFDPRSLNHLKREVKGRLEAAAAAAAGAGATRAEEGEEEAGEGELAAGPAATKKVFNIQVDATGEGLAAALGGLSLRGVASPRGRHTRFNDDGEGEGVSRNGLGKHIFFED